jgi:transketolase
MSLRLIPDLTVIRPADGNETAGAWRLAVEGTGPVALVLSRQGTPTLPVDPATAHEGVRRGGYVVLDDGGDPEVVLVATGTEVAVALEAAARLAEAGRATRVVSLPSWEIFESQDAAYRRQVLPAGVPTISVEAGVTLGWSRYARASVGIDRFGASAPGGTVLRELGITAEHVVEVAEAALRED